MIHICDRGVRVKDYINTCWNAGGWQRGLSPFVLGPVDLYDGLVAKNVENAWQYSKVYVGHADPHHGVPNIKWVRWAREGWANPRAVRCPMGKGVKPLFSWWDGEALDYVTARKRIYCPLYARCVERTESYRILEDLYKKRGELWLWDYDGYDHRKLGMTFRDVLNCPDRKMGHAFVLAMMLQGKRRWEYEPE